MRKQVCCIMVILSKWSLPECYKNLNVSATRNILISQTKICFILLVQNNSYAFSYVRAEGLRPQQQSTSLRCSYKPEKNVKQHRSRVLMLTCHIVCWSLENKTGCLSSSLEFIKGNLTWGGQFFYYFLFSPQKSMIFWSRRKMESGRLSFQLCLKLYLHLAAWIKSLCASVDEFWFSYEPLPTGF